MEAAQKSGDPHAQMKAAMEGWAWCWAAASATSRSASSS